MRLKNNDNTLLVRPTCDAFETAYPGSLIF